jgi:hypothetical protein
VQEILKSVHEGRAIGAAQHILSGFTDDLSRKKLARCLHIGKGIPGGAGFASESVPLQSAALIVHQARPGQFAQALFCLYMAGCCNATPVAQLASSSQSPSTGQ